jgi:hypothetical protein
MYDFACILDNGTKNIIWTAGGQYNEVAGLDGENLTAMILIAGLGCGLIYCGCTQKRRDRIARWFRRAADALRKYAATAIARVL